MPVIELQRRASTLASTALRTPKTEHLERAFAGEARGAFTWLQCFATGDDAAWCHTQGCPACIVTLTLATEAHVRLTIAASLVSTAGYTSPGSSRASSPGMEDAPSPSSPSSPADSDSHSQGSHPSLPPIPHLLPALRAALASDPFWGPDYWPNLLSRATHLSAGIQALMTDCVHLEALVSGSRASASPLLYLQSPTEPGMRLRKSKLAQRQLRMRGEEMAYMQRCAMQTWARASMGRGLRGKLLGLDVERGRRGSF